MASPPEQLRVRVMGALVVEGVDERALGSRKARVLLAALAVAGGRPVPVDVLTDVVWPEGAPARPAEQLQVLVSRLRRVVGADRLVRADAGYRLAADWSDLVELGRRVEEAEGRLAGGAYAGARAAAAAAVALAVGPLVPEVDAPWFDETRAATERLVRRAHGLLAEAALAAGDPLAAALAAEAVLDRDGYDEAALRLLMRAHDAAGRPASALAAYARVRATLADDLGVDPAPETEALHTAILRGEERTTRLTVELPPRIVGRSDEELRLLQLLTLASRGPAQAVTIEGEAGIGKSLLVEVFVGEARRRGAVVLEGRCDPLARDLPLQPVLEALRDHGRRLGPDHVGSWLGAEAARLGPLLDGGRRSAGSAATQVDDGAAGRATLFGDVLAVVERSATAAAVVVVIEDLHLADAATIDLLDHLVRHGSGLLVVVTRRPEGAGQLSAPGTRLVLGPLGLDDAKALVGAEAAALLPRSGGNPLFLLQLADARPGELPRSIVEAVQRRAVELGDGAAVLAAVAVLGPQVDLDLLGEALELPVGTLLDQLDAAVALNLLADDGLELRFAHEVVREALASTVTSTRRAHLHRLAARALARRSATDPTAVAWHATQGGDHELAATALAQAATTAIARFDAIEAERLLSQAIALHDGVDVRLQRARARIARFDVGPAAEDVARAIELGGGAAALETAGWVAYYRRDYDEARRCAEEGASRAVDPEVRASCLALAGRCRHTVGELAAAATALDAVVGAGPSVARPVAQIWMAQVSNHTGDPGRGLELSAAGLLDRTAIGHPFGVAHGHFAEALSLGMLGRPLDALRQLDTLVATVEGTDQNRRFVSVAANVRGWVLRWLGSFAAADACNRAAAALPIEPATAEFHYVGVLDLVEGRLLAGQPGAATELLDGIGELDRFVGSMAWRLRDRSELYRARVDLDEGRHAEAADRARRLAAGAGARGSRRHELFARSVAVAAAAVDGVAVDPAEVGAAVDDLPAVAGLEAWWYTATVARALGDDGLLSRARVQVDALVASAGEHGPGLRAWADEVLPPRR